MACELTGKNLTLEDIEAVSLRAETVRLSPQARRQVQKSRRVVEHALSEDRVVYGINTGFGNFRTVVVPRPDLEQLQTNLIRSHAAGVGDPFPEDIVRAILLLRINTLATGYSGVLRRCER
jgi:histidine ammonia-lyase